MYLLPKMHLLCSDDNLRPAMKGVYIQNGNAISTNGHVLSVCDLSDTHIQDIEYINGKIIKKNLWKLLCESNYISCSKDTISFRFDSIFIHVKESEYVINEKYPNLKNIFPKEFIMNGLKPVDSISFNPSYSDLIRRCYRIPPSGNKFDFYFYDKNKAILVKHNHYNYKNSISFIMPMQPEPDFNKLNEEFNYEKLIK